jgi:hypothetical protein
MSIMYTTPRHREKQVRYFFIMTSEGLRFTVLIFLVLVNLLHIYIYVCIKAQVSKIKD